MVKPIWLCDVDGVLNAVTKQHPGGWPVFSQEILNNYPIMWAPALMDRINTLLEAGKVEFQWLTTWGELANEHLCKPFTLPTATVAMEMPPRKMSGWAPNESGWWKLDAAQYIWENEKRPVIWTDDDIEYEHAAMGWLKEIDEGARYDEMLAITPRSHVGLTPEHMEEIEKFCERFAGDGTKFSSV